MPSSDPAFANAGKKRGVEIWRVKVRGDGRRATHSLRLVLQQFDLEAVPREQYGSFFEGDAYIVLVTKSNDSWDIHFWLGNSVTQDEAGTAAIKTVELDDHFSGLPVQNREVQNHESATFLSYFKGGIRYLQGGYASGFEHVVDPFTNYTPKLFQCKGKRNVRCVQVNCVKESLNMGDVFLLDLGATLLVWMPPESGRLERVKGVEQAKLISNQERAGRSTVKLIDTDWKTNAAFWKPFGGVDSVAWIKSARAGGTDESYWREKADAIALWRVSDASGAIQLTKVRSGAVKSSDLKPNDAFILDAGAGGLFVWIGKDCTMAERHNALKYGTAFLQKQMRPAWTQIQKVLSGAESHSFTQWFEDWQGAKRAATFTPKLFHVSNASGKLVIEEIADFCQEDLDTEDVHVLDAFNTIYVWVGAGANEAERNAADSTAQKYLATDAIPRHKKAEIEVLYESGESPGFKKLFPKWSDSMFDKKKKDHQNLRNLLFRQSSTSDSKPLTFAS